MPVTWGPGGADTSERLCWGTGRKTTGGVAEQRRTGTETSLDACNTCGEADDAYRSRIA